TVRRTFGALTAWLFALMMLFPFFCSGFLLSSYCGLTEYGLSILLWAFSLKFLVRHALTGRRPLFIAGYATLLLGLLSLAILLPLLIVTALLPAVLASAQAP